MRDITSDDEPLTPEQEEKIKKALELLEKGGIEDCYEEI